MLPSAKNCHINPHPPQQIRTKNVTSTLTHPKTSHNHPVSPKKKPQSFILTPKQLHLPLPTKKEVIHAQPQPNLNA